MPTKMGRDGDSESDSEISDFSYESDSGPEFDTIDEKEAADDPDSDAELEVAFRKGQLRPGLIDLRGDKKGSKEKTEPINNLNGLKNKFLEFQYKAPWIERMDLSVGMAALAPELNVEIKEHADKRQKIMSSKNNNFDIEEDPLHNDFKREMTFYRQAQAAVLDGYKRLKELKLPTMRPEDYFAQMAKTDDHMQKIRNRLLKKQKGLEISERVKKIRDIKKYGKKVQIEVEQKKIKEKKQMIETMNKYRKGQIDSIDFLEDGVRGKGGGKKPLSRGNDLKGNRGKDMKGKGKKGAKVPFGKNKYTKRNTAADVDGFPTKNQKRGKFGQKGGKGKNVRPGKAKRNSNMNKGKMSRSRRL